ncbi:Crp/Fnr family transcriptional regulator [Allomuricauda sp. SCSIO 65647]|uniref:Crp/Fnr family transcriptional regulator n=1 Tax=Allomuricauda sp. SCSIO 65647 TaxID=2908843 RepID=UPI001F165ADE|nr:Crp/Fnr family transcriptional regulator [Muricauda sp. SCSIO 65647]UJH66434.1 Crp/Fnr family transcriptional regulator [Muricauda sp. SCSIO 65647]
MTKAMNQHIKEQLDAISPLRHNTWNQLMEISAQLTISKSENLTDIGKYFNYEVFVLEGVLRMYHVTSDCKEYTMSFYKEGEFVAPSFTRQSHGRSLLNIQALENCSVLIFEEKKFTELRYKFRDLLVLGNKVSEKELMLKSKKEVLLATGNLKNLYYFFKSNHPNLESRIAQRHIASYLGADPVSLSRLKARILKENENT